MSQKHISVDFDGVIHSYISKWEGPEIIPDPPVPGAITFLIELINRKYTPAIFSTRSASELGKLAMQNYIKIHLLSYCSSAEEVNYYYDKIEWPDTKPPAILTIDDRAFHFEGTFPTIEYIKGFKPWNK